MSDVTAENDILDQSENAIAKLADVRSEVGKAIFGQKNIVDLALTTLLSGGHALLIGAPGLAKTKLVSTLGHVCGLHTNRIQFTADLMPADIIGTEILDLDQKGSRQLKFEKGPVFCQLLMADEINRASPRTQSALLEAMQERQVTVNAQTHNLGAAFHVLATQNPIEQEGAYPLPEAQLDRFLLSIHLDYPDQMIEKKILINTTSGQESRLNAILSDQDLLAFQKMVTALPVGEELCNSIVELIRIGRPQNPESPEIVKDYVSWGPSPRAGQALMLAVRAFALLNERVAPNHDDLLQLAKSALSHRIGLQPGAIAQGIDANQIIEEMLTALSEKTAWH